MSNSLKTIEWNRLAVEGLVIVVSILLAFAIDAWWDRQGELAEAEDQVARVVAELQANIAILVEQDQALEFTTGAAKELLSLHGPDAEPLPVPEFGALIAGLFAAPTLSLGRSATQDFISTGHLTQGRWVGVRLALAKLLAEGQTAEDVSLELRRMRPGILEHMQASVPALDIARQHPLMQAYTPSRFDSDTRSLLSDIGFESRIANYAIRMEINRDILRELLEAHRELIGQIEDAP